MTPETPFARIPLRRRLQRYFSDAGLVGLGMIMAALCSIAKLVFAFDPVEKEDDSPFIPNANTA